MARDSPGRMGAFAFLPSVHVQLCMHQMMTLHCIFLAGCVHFQQVSAPGEG